MKREEILAKWDSMTPRERDALVAEKVMDYSVTYDGSGLCMIEWEEEGYGRVLRHFNPSNNISAAWEVVEKINESGWMLYKLANSLSGLGVIDGYICILLHLESGASREVTSDSPSESITIAALLAVIEGQSHDL